MDIFKKIYQEKLNRKTTVSTAKEDSLNEFKRHHKEALDDYYYPRNGFTIEYIIIHHSLTKDGNTVNWDAIWKYHKSWRYKGNILTKEEAEKYQKEGKNVTAPWSTIGYHYGSELVDGEYEIQLGRNLMKPGAHCRDGGFNSKSIGICVVGNWDVEKPPEKQVLLTQMLVDKLMRVYKINKNNVIGHREAQGIAGVPEKGRKTCPGTQFNMENFREGLDETLV